MKHLKIALIGFGGIARSHFAAYTKLIREGAPIRLVAVCDANIEQFSRQITINNSSQTVILTDDIHTYTSVDDMLVREAFDMADICLPTHLHKDFSVKLLRAGKHVLCEKPMALCFADCEEMVRASHESGCQLLIGQCLRFSVPYLYLKKCIDEKPFGNILDLHMHRASESPHWSNGNWLHMAEKSGGCILDTHIHDVDIAHFLFGKPLAVSTLECNCPPYWQTQNTRLFFDNITVTADGSWHDMPNTGFSAGYKARFEHANLILHDGAVTVYPDGGDAYVAALPQDDYVRAEIDYFVNVLLSDAPNTINPPESARDTVHIIEHMKQSAACGGEKIAYVPKEN
ncbi:MAG: Gfo/Idh/MocA family oxidoreductase [Clostridia bacterium]|nr:Gfo/Idh/MocA family oxidoreductase [Clostridia bacterium]